MNRYIVIVYPAPPAKRDLDRAFYQASSVQTNRQPTVTRRTARTPEIAAEESKVPAGGYALVVPEENVRRFDRAPIASLEERAADGNPLIRDEAIEHAS